jgi:hypothetical protein
LTVPAAWDARGCDMMREAAITAGLVRSVGARDRDWRDRLRIITYALLHLSPRSIPNQIFFFFFFLQFSEPEAAAVHCAHLTDLHKLKPSQIFMICDAGGGTVVRLRTLLSLFPFDSGLLPHPTGSRGLSNSRSAVKP